MQNYVAICILMAEHGIPERLLGIDDEMQECLSTMQPRFNRSLFTIYVCMNKQLSISNELTSENSSVTVVRLITRYIQYKWCNLIITLKLSCGASYCMRANCSDISVVWMKIRLRNPRS